ncbi:MAG: aminopeptidase P family protein [Prevotella sp.]
MIEERLKALREIMRREHLAAFIFPSTDPHNGEYVPDHWKGREWISGFNGSAGTAVVTMEGAALWTDSRYFIAAAEQLAGTEFTLMKMKMEGTPTIAEWIGRQLADSSTKEVGIDGMVCSEAETQGLIAELREAGGLTLRTNLDPLDEIWADRPAVPLAPIAIHPIEYCGTTAHEKLCMIRRELRRVHADGMLVSALDDIAWTLNIRGNDVHCNPVAVSYLLISTSTATLYTDTRKLTADVKDYLRGEGVSVDEYKSISKGLHSYPDYNILLDPNETSHTLYKKVKRRIVTASSPIPAMKAVKTQAEQEGYRRAMLRDGVALVRFTRWLKEGAARHLAENGADTPIVIDGTVVTEMEADRRLTALRSEQELFRGISFDTIVGYGPHGAIVHYEATEETDTPLMAHGLVLIDSGGQYADGTTDITRTIPLGRLTDEERLVYTLVLKGHIGIERVKFPEGASGTQLDIMARHDMWRYGYNYLHGTGHGVGSYLNVHEAPHQIRMEYKPAPIVEGMTVTDEPGIYLEGRFGVRIENTLIARHYETALEREGHDLSPTPRFLEFEPLTLCPIDTEPIIVDMLTADEREWLNWYHQHVYETLSPALTDEADRQWLEKVCSPI